MFFSVVFRKLYQFQCFKLSPVSSDLTLSNKKRTGKIGSSFASSVSNEINQNRSIGFGLVVRNIADSVRVSQSA